MKLIHKRIAKGFLGATAISLLAACGSDNDGAPPVDTPPEEPAVLQEFEISVLNLTAAQPFSPIAVLAHTDAYSAFEIGSPVSVGLEQLAEGGDNSEFLAEANADTAVIATASAESPLGPGATETLSLSIEESQLDGALLTGITMLVNTNDAITAAVGLSLSGMEVGEQIQLNTISYDSGTEGNTELAGTIPGPADGGEGFNAARDDIADEVRMHSGILSAADGLAESVLTEIHRWDNPVARVTITRVE